ncbi:MAG: ribonuclease III [Chloroflexi bacterium GWC2_73_18]|nr:MAG: ribonuclease III [Chloroflexi bacterium GWC2_73_18]
MKPAAELARRIGLPIPDLTLLEQALVHGSFPNERPAAAIASNERLEFLGDVVVGLVVSEVLYARHPDDDEGGLTARRAAIVSTHGLARLARRLGLEELLRVGQGADRSGARRRPSVLAAAFEAIVGALYLTAGLEATRDWLVQFAAAELASETPVAALKSPKNRLQEAAYALSGHPPSYRVVSAEGPQHAKHFVVELTVGEMGPWRGEGESRRAAETEAALRALGELLPDTAVSGEGTRR